MKLNVKQSLDHLQKEGTLFSQLFAHGTLQVEIYKPQKVDLQQPHSRDELYVIATGTSHFAAGEQQCEVEAGDVLFVPARMEHRFTHFSDDFSTWVFFYGPEGGEQS
jgi:uncharacterized protein YjlB